MGSSSRSVQQTCRCENCGNESEMTVVCTLPEAEPAPAPSEAAPAKSPPPEPVGRAKGTATCTHCGNEAEMWVELQ